VATATGAVLCACVILHGTYFEKATGVSAAVQDKDAQRRWAAGKQAEAAASQSSRERQMRRKARLTALENQRLAEADDDAREQCERTSAAVFKRELLAIEKMRRDMKRRKDKKPREKNEMQAASPEAQQTCLEMILAGKSTRHIESTLQVQRRVQRRREEKSASAGAAKRKKKADKDGWQFKW